MKFFLCIIILINLAFIGMNCSNTSNQQIATRKNQVKISNPKVLQKTPVSEAPKITTVGSDLTVEEARTMVELHNIARAEVGVGPVIWSAELAMYAQEWAKHLAESGCKMEHRPRSGKWKQKYGENIFMGTAGFYGVADASKSWESEKQYYHGQTLNASNWYDSGHYTQMVWSNTTQIGCAKVECNGSIIIVCNYDPPGNYMGEKPY